MNTLGIDALRADIFKELMKLDKEKLSEVYKFVKKTGFKRGFGSAVVARYIG